MAHPAPRQPVLADSIYISMAQVDVLGEGMTMVVVTHEIRFANKAADRVVLMADGGIAEEGTPEQVLENPTSERGQAFLRQIEES